MAASTFALLDLLVKVLVLGGTATAAIVAARTYLRTEQWKRAEFLAREMKEFFADARVQNALTMIDWSSRTLPLLPAGSENDGRVRVTRALGIRALLPHVMLNSTKGSDAEAQSTAQQTEMRAYTAPEAAIRDCFDALLDGLERFAFYVHSGLVTVAELRPYLQYWIDDVAAEAKDDDDAAWSAVFLTYIEFYHFMGVQWLFRAFGKPIDRSSDAYAGFLTAMSDRSLAAALKGTLGTMTQRIGAA